MYNDFSEDYDRFVNWPARLAFELPFIRSLFPAGVSILDAACGTGMHTLALAQEGYQAVGADLSEGMVARARANAASSATTAAFEVAGFGQLRRTFLRNFDGLICLGNSLPHLLTKSALEEALNDFSACLKPGGLLLVQNRNFDAVLSHSERWMEPQGDARHLFVRFYDFESGGLVNFNIIALKHESLGWQQRVFTSQLHPWRKAELEHALKSADWADIAWYGNLQGAPFDPAQSSNLVFTARRK
ncbi:MAG TPA: class I SAM-dependent methyltransferase [Anaerolineaceae bacterium]|nr:class I SAM-dependent methyltransferase [Anaerolineaceae bacterium]HPN52227.1 class I SAM-dependent methyltransferase [Anaerolineaceae bacterium]